MNVPVVKPQTLVDVVMALEAIIVMISLSINSI